MNTASMYNQSIKNYMKIADEVAAACMKGESKHKGPLHTNGKEIFSYALKIAERTGENELTVYDYTNKTGNFKSHTTSTHVGALARMGFSKLIPPTK